MQCHLLKAFLGEAGRQLAEIAYQNKKLAPPMRASRICTMRMRMKKLRLKSDAQRLSVSEFADRFASRMWLKRQSFVPHGADLADLGPESGERRLRLDSRLNKLRRRLICRHYRC